MPAKGNSSGTHDDAAGGGGPTGGGGGFCAAVGAEEGLVLTGAVVAVAVGCRKGGAVALDPTKEPLLDRPGQAAHFALRQRVGAARRGGGASPGALGGVGVANPRHE